MARRMAMTMVLATVFGLGVLTGAGLALPWKQAPGTQAQERTVQEQRATVRPADAARAEAVFAAHWRVAAAGRSPAHPLPICPACIQAAACQGLDESAARAQCAAACGLDE